jgi:hypothetical protein
LILSASVQREHQGIAASLVTTVVNYSISIGLGIAGTVEVHVNKEGKDVLSGYRGAFTLALAWEDLAFSSRQSHCCVKSCNRERRVADFPFNPLKALHTT